MLRSIQVFILPDRLKPEARQGIIDGKKKFLLLTDFDDVYLEYFKTFRTNISKALVRPREFIQGTALTGGSIADFMCSFAEAINKSEPLNIPSIFESAQNDAINKAIASFTTSLTLTIDGRLKEDAKPTQALSLAINKDVNLLLSQLASTISYMAPSIIRQVQNTAFESAQPMKEALLNTNLARLMEIMSSGLTAAIMSIPTLVLRLFPPTDLLLAADTIQNRFNALWVEIFEAYKSKGESLDVRAFPEKWDQVLQEATEGEKTSVSSRVEGAWDAWALNASQQMLSTLTEGLVELGKNTQVGEIDSYESAARFLLQNIQLDFEKKMAAEYWGSKKEAQKKAFATAADSALKTQLAQWQRNAAEIKKQLQRLLDRLTKEYEIRLQNSLSPRVEPPPYEDIVDVTPFRVGCFLKNPDDTC